MSHYAPFLHYHHRNFYCGKIFLSMFSLCVTESVGFAVHLFAGLHNTPRCFYCTKPEVMLQKTEKKVKLKV